MPQDVTFSLGIKLHTRVSGWLHGRINNSGANITNTADGNQLIEVSGTPAVVPAFLSWQHASALPTVLNSYYKSNPKFLCQVYGFGGNGPNACAATYKIRMLINQSEQDMEEFLLWLPFLNDTAPYAPTEWAIRSMQNHGDDQKTVSMGKIN